MASPPPHVSYHPFKHFKQKLCRQERCLGSVNKSEHTEQDTSSRRLWNKVVKSMMSSTTSELWPLKQFILNNEVLWSSIFSLSRNLKGELTNQRTLLWEDCYYFWFMIPITELERSHSCGKVESCWWKAAACIEPIHIYFKPILTCCPLGIE